MRWTAPRRTSFQDLRGAATGRSGPISVSFVPGGCPATLAFAIGKKVGNAVVRNRLRRRLRELVRLRLDLRCGAYLVRARPEAAELGFEELGACLVQATRRFAAPEQAGEQPQQ